MALKKAEPRVSLGWYFLGVQFVDLLWPIFCLAGLESFTISPGITAYTPLDFQHYPYTHSLVAGGVWALLLAAISYFVYRSQKASMLIAVAVLSHWALDFFTHRPDMPLAFNGPKWGLGLWNHFAATIIVETSIFIAGLYLYLSSVSFVSKKRKVAFYALVSFLLVVSFMNAFGPPPPSEEAVSYSALGLWLMVAWAHFADAEESKS